MSSLHHQMALGVVCALLALPSVVPAQQAPPEPDPPEWAPIGSVPEPAGPVQFPGDLDNVPTQSPPEPDPPDWPEPNPPEAAQAPPEPDPPEAPAPDPGGMMPNELRPSGGNSDKTFVQ